MIKFETRIIRTDSTLNVMDVEYTLAGLPPVVVGMPSSTADSTQLQQLIDSYAPFASWSAHPEYQAMVAKEAAVAKASLEAVLAEAASATKVSPGETSAATPSATPVSK